MLGKIFSVLVTSSFVFAALSGRMNELSQAVTEGAEGAVSLSLSLLGMMCLWSGIIRVFDGAGVTNLISRCIRPLLGFVYPDAHRTGNGMDEICANFAANLLGLGNAALPSGLSAMEKLSRNEDTKKDMLTFAVMNTVPIQLFPTTLIALREAAGSAQPYDVIPPIYVCSVMTVCFAALLCRFLAWVTSARKARRKERKS